MLPVGVGKVGAALREFAHQDVASHDETLTFPLFPLVVGPRLVTVITN